MYKNEKDHANEYVDINRSGGTFGANPIKKKITGRRHAVAP